MNLKKRLIAAAITSAALAPLAALAQSSTGSAPATGTGGLGSTEATSYSLIPSTSRGYIGANLGWPDIDGRCTPGFACDDANVGGKIYTGGSWNEMFGAEIGYINFGTNDRNGGEVSAQGVNFSLVGNIPLVDVFNIFAKVGVTYAWTETTAALITGVRTGDEDDFALSYGAGIGFDLTNNFEVVAEWERHDLRFVAGRENADLFSLGVKYTF
jgi:opacity protein-like surface antigen